MNPEEYEKAKGPMVKSIIRVLAGKGFTVGQGAEILIIAAEAVRGFAPLNDEIISEIENFEKLAEDSGYEVSWKPLRYTHSDNP